MFKKLFNNKRSKYGNKKVKYEGLKFDSEKERDRYIFLKEQEKLGNIQDLQLQVRYELIPAIKEEYVEHLKTKDKVKTRTIQLAITYTCDFQYYKNGELVIEDVKSHPKMLTKEYALKKKMLFALKGLKITEVYKPTQQI